MTPSMLRKTSKVAALLAASLSIAGCGGDTEENKKPIERGIVTSALECADIYNLKVATCQTAIRTAIAKHESSSTTYTRLHKCEAAEGPQRCERAGEKAFSRRLQAFLLGITDPLLAAPLYATTDGKAGFVRIDGSVMLLDDDVVKFSEQAAVMAEGNANLPAKAASGGL